MEQKRKKRQWVDEEVKVEIEGKKWKKKVFLAKMKGIQLRYTSPIPFMNPSYVKNIMYYSIAVVQSMMKGYLNVLTKEYIFLIKSSILVVLSFYLGKKVLVYDSLCKLRPSELILRISSHLLLWYYWTITVT